MCLWRRMLMTWNGVAGIAGALQWAICFSVGRWYGLEAWSAAGLSLVLAAPLVVVLARKKQKEPVLQTGRYVGWMSLSAVLGAIVGVVDLRADQMFPAVVGFASAAVCVAGVVGVLVQRKWREESGDTTR
jgi:hypothetical protein